MRRNRWLRNHMIARTAFDNVGNFALDAIIRWHFRIVFQRLLFYQFRLWHRICTFDQGRHTRQQTDLFFFRCLLWLFEHRFKNRLGHNVGHSRFVRETARGSGFLFGAQGLALLSLSRLHHARSTNSPFCPLTDQTHRHHIRHNNANREKTSAFFHFKTGRAKHKGEHHNCRNRKEESHKLQAECRAERQECKESAKDSVTKQTAKTKCVCPCRAGNKRGHVDSADDNSDGEKNDPAQRTFCTKVQNKANAPRNRDNRNNPSGLTNDHKQWRSNRRAHLAKPVLHGRICRGQPAWVSRRVRSNNHRSQNAKNNQRCADHFFATLFNHGLHIAIQKRIASPCLICHSRSSFLCE